MNESGLDPGIDHMLAMECFDEIKEHGGKVISFYLPEFRDRQYHVRIRSRLSSLSVADFLLQNRLTTHFVTSSVGARRVF